MQAWAMWSSAAPPPSCTRATRRQGNRRGERTGPAAAAPVVCSWLRPALASGPMSVPFLTSRRPLCRCSLCRRAVRKAGCCVCSFANCVCLNVFTLGMFSFCCFCPRILGATFKVGASPGLLHAAAWCLLQAGRHAGRQPAVTPLPSCPPCALRRARARCRLPWHSCWACCWRSACT